MILSCNGFYKGTLKSFKNCNNKEVGKKYYTVYPPTLQEAVIDDTFLTCTDPFTFGEIGELLVLEYEGFSRSYEIKNISNDKKRIILETPARDERGEVLREKACKIKQLQTITKLVDLPEGCYIVSPTNVKIIVKKDWLNPSLNYLDLFALYPDAGGQNSELIKKSERLALKLIYSDLAVFPDIENFISDVNFYLLLLYKTACLLSQASNLEDNIYCSKYKELLKTYEPRIKKDAKGEINVFEIKTGERRL